MSTDFDLDRVAYLARLRIPSTEKEIIEPRVQAVMEMINALQKVDTKGIAPMITPLEQYQRQREDVVTASDQHKIYQALAPAVAYALYLVPKVIE